MQSISLRQKQILDYIIDFIRKRGYAPSVRDIASGCDISSSSLAQYHLKVLERQGYIHRDPEISRSIALVKSELSANSIPLLGTIAAGQPIPVPSSDTWISAPEELLELPEYVTGRLDRVYGLRVQGTSMIDALVDDGDIVILQAASSAEDGEMVAAWLKNRREVTLKKLYRESGRIRLQPANQTMAPIYVDPDEIEVQGRVIAVLRKYHQQLP